MYNIAMNILAFDSSTETLSIALWLDGTIKAFTGEGGPKASALILPKIKELLLNSNMQLSDLNGIAFGAGPGAFTGIRVACGVAQGLGFGANCPVVGINTLHAMAQSFWPENSPIKALVCLDARMGEVYFAAIEKIDDQKNGFKWQEVCPIMVCKAENCPEIIGENWVGIGNGWHIFEALLREKYAKNIANVLCNVSPNISPSIMPKASAVAVLALPIFAAGKAQPASQAVPIYIRNRVALTTAERLAGLRL